MFRYVFLKLLDASDHIQNTVSQVTNNLITFEPQSQTRITAISNVFLSVLTNGLDSMPALVNGVTTIRLQGKYKLETLLLITNTTSKWH